MKPLPTRSRVLIGGLILAVAVLAIDSFTGGGPTEVQAGQQADQEPEQPPVDWGEVDTLIDDLTKRPYSSVAPELDTLERDLFVDTSTANAVSLAESPPPLPGTPAEGEDPNAAPVLAFSDQHVLGGVVTGANPLAVIDDQVLRINSDLDGYTLVEIHRDFVVFQECNTDQQVRLTLSPAPEN